MRKKATCFCFVNKLQRIWQHWHGRGEGGRSVGKGSENHKKGCPKPQGDRKEAALLFFLPSQPPPSPPHAKGTSKTRQDCQKVSLYAMLLDKCGNPNKKNHLKYFANKFKSQTPHTQRRSSSSMRRGCCVRRALPKQWRSGNLFARVDKNTKQTKPEMKWEKGKDRRGKKPKKKGKCGEFVRR